jgi:hypothetical protein
MDLDMYNILTVYYSFVVLELHAKRCRIAQVG